MRMNWSFAGWHRLGRWLLACSFAWLGVWGWSQVNLDKTQALALERYGPPAAEVIGAWRRMIEESRSLPEAQKLAVVNTFFNRRMVYEVDAVVWRQNDYWATPLEFMGRATGDCEDFSISKYMTLLMMGVPNEKLRMIYVRARATESVVVKSEAHMVLGYYDSPNAEPLILDNLISSIRPASRRSDLTPVFSFNSQGLWVAGSSASAADPTARLSRWREVLERMKAEGL